MKLSVRHADFDSSKSAPSPGRPLRAVLIDLNNFASFPTLAIGILVASLRNAQFDVTLISPLAHDVPAIVRERREGLRHRLQRRLNLSTFAPARLLRDFSRSAYYGWRMRPHSRTLRETAKAFESNPDVVLLSAYLEHYRTVVEIGKLAAARGVPVLLGGPAFNLSETADAWRTVPGLTALVGGEVDNVLPEIVKETIDGGDLLRFDGVVLPDGRRSRPAPPLRHLDRTPLPDFTDFPWDRYPTRIVPVMTGRGCQWDNCLFCSDVVSVSGRTYRTRSVQSVLSEMQEQSRRHQTANFLFLDLKLNSNPNMMRGIAESIQVAVPGAQWVGTVHVDTRADNGLSRRDLNAAAGSGMRRISFGLESGSQRLLDLMNKGSTVETNAAFIRHAHEAGLSVRCTMFKGYPGEVAEDLEKTAVFLQKNAPYIDRIRFNDFSIAENTPIYNAVASGDEDYGMIRPKGRDRLNARFAYVNAETGSREYRRQKARVLALVGKVNGRHLKPLARAFDGLM